MINKIILLGRLGKDAEVKYTASGTAVVNFSMVTDHYAGQERGKVPTWHRVVAWGKLGESLGKYLLKGRIVYVEGRQDHRQWKDKEDATRVTAEVIAEKIQLVGGGKHDNTGGHDESVDEGIPF